MTTTRTVLIVCPTCETRHDVTFDPAPSGRGYVPRMSAALTCPACRERAVNDWPNYWLTCKHCGRLIEGNQHVGGQQRGMQRCDPTDTGLRYGYNAEPVGAPCTASCYGAP